MDRLGRVLASASLIALLAACGGEGGRDREDGPADREKPSLGAPQDGQDREDEKESRADQDGDSDD